MQVAIGLDPSCSGSGIVQRGTAHAAADGGVAEEEDDDAKAGREATREHSLATMQLRLVLKALSFPVGRHVRCGARVLFVRRRLNVGVWACEYVHVSLGRSLQVTPTLECRDRFPPNHRSRRAPWSTPPAPSTRSRMK